jgi:hypothetical protein
MHEELRKLPPKKIWYAVVTQLTLDQQPFKEYADLCHYVADEVLISRREILKSVHSRFLANDKFGLAGHTLELGLPRECPGHVKSQAVIGDTHTGPLFLLQFGYRLNAKGTQEAALISTIPLTSGKSKHISNSTPDKVVIWDYFLDWVPIAFPNHDNEWK